MEHLRQSILEAESKTGRRLIELRREFNKLSAGAKVSDPVLGNKEKHKFLGSWKDTQNKDKRRMVLPNKNHAHGYGYNVDICVKKCNKHNDDNDTQFNVVGLQDGGECWCAGDKEKWRSEGLAGDGKKFCYKRQKKADGQKHKYVTDQQINKGLRINPGEGGGAWCNDVYEMKQNSARKLEDKKNDEGKEVCWVAGKGAIDKKPAYKNITPEECAYFMKGKPFAIDAYGDEYGRFNCYRVKDEGNLEVAKEGDEKVYEVQDLDENDKEDGAYGGKVCDAEQGKDSAGGINDRGQATSGATKNVKRVLITASSGASSSSSSSSSASASSAAAASPVTVDRKKLNYLYTRAHSDNLKGRKLTLGEFNKYLKDNPRKKATVSTLVLAHNKKRFPKRRDTRSSTRSGRSTRARK